MKGPALPCFLLLLLGAFLVLSPACSTDDSEQGFANNAAPSDASASDASDSPYDTSTSIDVVGFDASGSDTAGSDATSFDTARSDTTSADTSGDRDWTPAPPKRAVGVPCAGDSDCPSGQCESVGGQRRGACTVACQPGDQSDDRSGGDTNAACPAGWTCETIYSGDGNFCTCESSPETCDGQDNDCDGLVDEGDQNTRLCGADALCTTNICECPSGFSCQNACRDLYRDPNHCGGCDVGCDVACSDAKCVVAVDVSVGADHVCAALSDGRVRCVGQNDHGQLGDGTTSSSERPVDALWMTDTVQVAAADRFSCARNVAGAVHCWGYNGQGQVADAPLTERHRPTRWTQIDDAVDLDIGHYTGCVVTSAGDVMCWGPHGFAVPTVVEGSSDATEVAVGDFHRCALVNNGVSTGQVACWGKNTNGQLGDGTTFDRDELHLIPMLTDAIKVDAGEEHTCVLLDSGSVKCFGTNSHGQLGTAQLAEQLKLSPSQVDGLAAATDVTTGARHSCAIAGENHKVFCWGQNQHGQLGDGTTGASSAPVEVRGLSDVQHVEAGVHTTCALTTDGDVHCWGERFGVNPRPVSW
jgi:alpha-tubulin suppressor-like RCC1 family protein